MLSAGWCNPDSYPAWLDVRFHILATKGAFLVDSAYHGFWVYAGDRAERRYWWRRDVDGLDEHLLLQPTRIVPRKRIEHAIELARRLDLKCTLVISHASSDEGTAYEAYLGDYAKLMGVRVLFASDIIAYHRGQGPDGRKIFALADAYQQADLVTYPSTVEGFGNAFLETIYYRRPIVMSVYEIFKTDIQPKGFKPGFRTLKTE